MVTFAIPLCILKSKSEIHVPKGVICRDLSFSLITVFTNFLFGIDGKINTSDAIIFLTIYIIYIITVYVTDKPIEIDQNLIEESKNLLPTKEQYDLLNLETRKSMPVERSLFYNKSDKLDTIPEESSQSKLQFQNHFNSEKY